MDQLQTQHAIWQDRVAKERKSSNSHLHTYYSHYGMKTGAGDPYAPHVKAQLVRHTEHTSPQSMHRTWSTPTLGSNVGIAPLLQPELTGGSRTPILRRIATGGSSQMYPLDATGGGGCPATGGPAPPRTGRSASASRAQSSWGLEGPPRTGMTSRSRGSAGTGFSSASMRREVQEAVQEEVMRLVGPLKGQLDQKIQEEAAERRRLEGLLARARGQPT